jgi:hypothetical protein
VPATQDFLTYAASRHIEQHYNPTQYYDTDVRDDDPEATARNFKQLNGRGLVVIVTYGSADRLLVASYRTQGADPAGYANVLDGNTHPPNAEHVGPAGDSHWVRINCVAAPPR